MACDSLIRVFTKLEVPQTFTEVGASLFVLLTNPVLTGEAVVMGKLEVGLQKLTLSLITGKLKSRLVGESLMTGAWS